MNVKLILNRIESNNKAKLLGLSRINFTLIQVYNKRSSNNKKRWFKHSSAYKLKDDDVSLVRLSFLLETLYSVINYYDCIK